MDDRLQKIEGIVFGIQRFSIHDGPGIRTTMFLKGCNVNCVWCHNPEGIPVKQMLSYNASKCIGCGGCAVVCPAGVHTFEERIHKVNRGLCRFCGKCVEACPAEALEVLGERVTAGEAVRQLLRDKNYFTGEGGITLSGGEALLQREFAAAILAGVKEEGIKCALETNGTLPWEYYEEVLPYVDIFLVDYKVTNPEIYKKYVGGDNSKVEANIRRLHDAGAHIRVRCPIIPGVNDTEDHFRKIAELTLELPNLEGAELLPYHKLGISKAARIGIESEEFEMPSNETVQGWKDYIIGLGGRMVNVE